jgi:hypothetical protein
MHPVQVILCHLSYSIPQVHLQRPLLIASTLKQVLYPLQVKTELCDLVTSINSRQILKGIEETNLCPTLVPETGRLIPMSSCLTLAVLELFIHRTRWHCPVFLIIALVMEDLVGLTFKGIREPCQGHSAPNALCVSWLYPIASTWDTTPSSE